MRRRLLTVASALSLLLFAVLTGEAVRGIWRLDRLKWQPRGATIRFTSNWGSFSLLVGRGKEADAPTWMAENAWREMPWELGMPATGLIHTEFDRFGFGYASGLFLNGPPYEEDGTQRKARFWLVAVPSWLPPFVTALLPAWWLPRAWRFRRGLRRVARGCCAACGYNLAGIASTACPECGTLIPTKAGTP